MTTIESAATTIREPGAGFEFDEPQLVQMAARDADPRTTTLYDRRRQNFDRHAAYVVVAFVAGG